MSAKKSGKREKKKPMEFNIYFKLRGTTKIESRVAVRVDEKEGVVWLKNGGWIALADAFLTKERAEDDMYQRGTSELSDITVNPVNA